MKQTGGSQRLRVTQKDNMSQIQDDEETALVPHEILMIYKI